ncbi:MAG: hypothetical protein RLZZ574_357, partial [Cyanobacteriota bacterium]
RQLVISADRSRIIQVFINLLDNAIKHSSAGNEILVQVLAHSSKQIKIDVIDSGSGFNTLDLPYIFERLYRGDKSRAREPQITSADGSGLGLAIVEQIIQAHGGRISAKNHPQIGGAWLEILLPINQV